MPGLVAFGRRWRIGGDDLVVPAALFSFCDAIWLIVCAFGLPTLSVDQKDAVSESEISQCYLLRILLIVCMLFFLFCTITDGAVAFVSTRGTIMDSRKRSVIPYLVYIRAALLIGQFACAVAGLTLILSFGFHRFFLSSAASNILIATIWWNLVVCLSAVVVVGLIYDPVGAQWEQLKKFEKSKLTAIEQDERRRIAQQVSVGETRKRHFQLAYQDAWFHRCKGMLCCLPKSQNERGSLREVAELLADFFVDSDLVPSDIVAGLVLLRRRQKQIRKRQVDRADTDTLEYLSGAAITSSTKFLDFMKPESLELLNELRYYMQYALASYGWPFYLNENHNGRLCTLLKNIKCCRNFDCCGGRAQNREIVNDDCCFGNSTALKLTIADHVQVIYANFYCGIGKSPFFVAVDSEKKAVVVCVRGTLSLTDFVTDFHASAQRIPLPVDGTEKQVPTEQYLAHKGVVIGAEYIHEKLISGGILEEAFAILKTKEQQQLVLVGHSLGAGIATVLGLMLRRRPEEVYRRVRCVAFSPPGGLLTIKAVEETEQFCTAVMVGKDCVPRLGLQQITALTHDIVSLLHSARDTKWKIIGHSLPLRCLRTSVLKTDRRRSFLHDSTVFDATSTTTQSNGCRSRHRSCPAVILPCTTQRLYPPGRLLHVVRTWTEDRAGYAAIWTDVKAVAEMAVSPVMIADHMPAGVIQALDGVIESCLKAQQSVLDLNLPPVFSTEFYKRRSKKGKHYDQQCLTVAPALRCHSSPVMPVEQISLHNEQKSNVADQNEMEQVAVEGCQAIDSVAGEQGQSDMDALRVEFTMGAGESSEQLVSELFAAESGNDQLKWFCPQQEQDSAKIWRIDSGSCSMIPEVARNVQCAEWMDEHYEDAFLDKMPLVSARTGIDSPREPDYNNEMENRKVHSESDLISDIFESHALIRSQEFDDFANIDKNAK